MPGLNRRGPNNEGSMTGRKMGRCNPDNKGKSEEEFTQNRIENVQEQEMSFRYCRSFRRNRGFQRGFGFRRRFMANS